MAKRVAKITPTVVDHYSVPEEAFLVLEIKNVENGFETGEDWKELQELKKGSEPLIPNSELVHRKLSEIRKICFNGHSDDLVSVSEESNTGWDFESYRYSEDVAFVVENEAGRILVKPCLSNGRWSFAVGQAKEDEPVPVWPTKFRKSSFNGYSTELVIEAPASASVSKDEARR